jgi:hypothetical protein
MLLEHGVDIPCLLVLSVDYVLLEHGVPHKGPKGFECRGCTREI